MSQLTLTLDDELIAAAQAYARQHGQQLDALVAELLQATVRPAPATPAKSSFSPEVQELIGSLRLPKNFDYKTELGKALDERFGL
ncbi:MAG: DUF6364 family protein [Janthinobacterium lividum]